MITRTLPADVDLLDLHRLDPARYPVLLESSATGAHGRWDMLLAHDGTSFALRRDGLVRDQEGANLQGRFLDVLDARWQSLRVPRDDGDTLPFRGGWALLLGYELAQQVEPVLRLPHSVGALPVACALRCPAAVLRNRVTGECIAIAEAGAGDWLERVGGDVESARALPALPEWQAPAAIDEDASQRYVDGVQRVLEYLVAGDVFQVNLSRGWTARFEASLDPPALFQRLRGHNPAPFAGIFRTDAGSVVSASPERLVSVRGDV
ncbi:MAG TPA: chorismate-binding protein, partial [Thermomonas sp.]|nr:chorismate-binding protein [Thermomonas sp.]